MSTPEETIKAALADHARADWSDGTYACGGCKKRSPNAWKLEGETEEQARERRARYDEVLYPGWSFDEYNAHVAREVALALGLADGEEASEA